MNSVEIWVGIASGTVILFMMYVLYLILLKDHLKKSSFESDEHLIYSGIVSPKSMVIQVVNNIQEMSIVEYNVFLMELRLSLDLEFYTSIIDESLDLMTSSEKEKHQLYLGEKCNEYGFPRVKDFY